MYIADFGGTLSKVEADIPHPVGYQVLVAIPLVEKKTAGGIIIVDELLDREKTASITGFVIGLGADAYRSDKFSEPYCKEGDWVMFRSYTGTRFMIGDLEFRLINDDTVQATVPSPLAIKRAA